MNEIPLTKFEKFLIGIIVSLILSVAFVQTYKIGKRHGVKINAITISDAKSYKVGYANGWADAQCGHGNDCEGGQQ